MSNSLKSSDGTLLERWTAQRDAEAFAELVARYAGLVYGTCRRVLGNAADAEDAAQECFMKLSQADPKVGRSLGGWLHRVATNRCLDQVRSETRRRDRESRYSEMAQNSEEPSWQDIQSFVDEAIAELPDDLRMPIVQHFLQGKTQGGAARTLGVSRSAISRRIQRGTDRIRKSLKKRGIPITTGSLAALMAANLAEAAPVSLIAALGKLALAGTGKAVGGAAATSVVAVGGVVLIKKLVIGVAVVIVGAITLWALKPETPVEPKVEIAQVERPAVQEEEFDLVTEEESPEPGVEPVGVVDANLGTITGWVYEAETGEPIRDVTIRLKPRPAGDETTARTDQNGAYRFVNLRSGHYEVWREAGTAGLPAFYEPETCIVTVERGSLTESVDFPVIMGVRVTGNVVDVNGSPVRGAKVEGVGYQLSESSTRALPGGTTHACLTGPDGTFELVGLTAGDQLRLGAAKGDELISEGFGPVPIDTGGLSDVELILHPTASISGRVTDSQGVPLADVSVWPRCDSAFRSRDRVLMGIPTGSDGSFDIIGLAAGVYKLRLTPEWGTRHLPKVAPPWDEFRLGHGEHLKGVTVVLDTEPKSELRITGRVVDTEGYPIRDARVSANAGTGTRSGGPPVHTDSNGSYELEWLIENLFYHLVVAHEDYVETGSTQVEAGSEDIEIVMKERGVIEERVVDDRTGAPVAHFQTRHIDDENRRFRQIRKRFQRWRDKDGAFRIERVAPGPATVYVKALGYAESVVEVPNVGVGETVRDIEILLSAGVSVNGVVLDLQGDPIENAFIIPGEMPRPDTSPVSSVTQTDSEGKFYLTNQSLDLKVIAAYHPDYVTGSSVVALDADRENTVTIVLSKGGIVQGTVYYGDKPWPDQRLWLSIRGPGSYIAITGADGSYRFDRLKPGEVEISAEVWQRFDERTSEIRRVKRTANVVEGETVVVDFHITPATATVEGLVTADGKPFNGVWVNLKIETADGQETFSYQVGADGSYKFEDVPAGSGVLRVRDETSNMSRQAEFEIMDGETIRKDIEFASGGAVAGYVSGLGSDEQAFIFVIPGTLEITAANRGKTIRQYFSEGKWPQRVPENGLYHCGGLKREPYTVLAMVADRSGNISSERGFVVAHVDLTEESTHQLDLVFD